jgi:hypothetical protein
MTHCWCLQDLRLYLSQLWTASAFLAAWTQAWKNDLEHRETPTTSLLYSSMYSSLHSGPRSYKSKHSPVSYTPKAPFLAYKKSDSLIEKNRAILCFSSIMNQGLKRDLANRTTSASFILFYRLDPNWKQPRSDPPPASPVVRTLTSRRDLAIGKQPLPASVFSADWALAGSNLAQRTDLPPLAVFPI